MSLDNLGRIDIYINPRTLNIEKVFATPIQLDITLKPCQNMIALLKQFKPCYSDYPAFNALLTELKLLQKRPLGSSEINKSMSAQIIYRFKNNQGFLETIISQFEMSLVGNIFTIELDIEDNFIQLIIFANRSALQLMDLVSPDIFEATNQVKFPDLLKHELTNSLNIINMSSILINTELETAKYPGTLAIYNGIIRDELDSAVNLLNIIGTISSKAGVAQVRAVDFYKYIDKYLESVDSIYSIHNDGKITISCPDSAFLSNTYLTIQLSWLKVILDNIFKNIYGHLGHTSNKRFTGFILEYSIEQSCIIININNCILQESTNNINKCHLYNQLACKQDLLNNTVDTGVPLNSRPFVPFWLAGTEWSLLEKKGGVNGTGQSNLIPCIPDNQSQGITIIDTLCTKQNIKWGLYECASNEYTFELRIPFTLNSHPPPNFCSSTMDMVPACRSATTSRTGSFLLSGSYQQEKREVQTVTCRQDNKYKKYLNASTQQRETFI
jgi:hypothetical protein